MKRITAALFTAGILCSGVSMPVSAEFNGKYSVKERTAETDGNADTCRNRNSGADSDWDARADRFEPNTNITKAQVAQVLYNMEQQPEITEKKVFEVLGDVYEAEWYALPLRPVG